MSPVSKSNDSNDWSLFKKQRNVVNSEIRLAKQAYYQNSVFIVSDKTLPFSYHSSCLFYIKGLLLLLCCHNYTKCFYHLFVMKNLVVCMTLYPRKIQCRKTVCSRTEYVVLFEINIFLNLDCERKF